MSDVHESFFSFLVFSGFHFGFIFVFFAADDTPMPSYLAGCLSERFGKNDDVEYCSKE